MQRLRKELLNMPKRRNVEACPGDPSRRILLLNPSVQDAETLEGEFLFNVAINKIFVESRCTHGTDQLSIWFRVVSRKR